MADHKSYMHDSFPSSKNSEEHSNAQFTHAHDLTHEDPHLRGRTEEHSVKGGGIGTMQSGHGNRGTI